MFEVENLDFNFSEIQAFDGIHEIFAKTKVKGQYSPCWIFHPKCFTKSNKKLYDYLIIIIFLIDLTLP